LPVSIMPLCVLLLLIGSASAKSTVGTEEEILVLQNSARVTKANCKNIGAILSGKAKPEPFPLGGLTGIAAVNRMRRVPHLTEVNCHRSFNYVAPPPPPAPICPTNDLLAGLSTVSSSCQATLGSALPPTNAVLDYDTQTCPCYREIPWSYQTSLQCRSNPSDQTSIWYDMQDCHQKAPVCDTNALLAGLSTVSSSCQATLGSALPPTNAVLNYATQTCPCYKEVAESTAATLDCRAAAHDRTTIKYDVADCKANH